MSTFKVEVVPIKLESHPNADALSIVRVWGYQVVVRTEDFIGKDIAIYIPPDSLVDVKKEWFKWLEGQHRIKARRFRGEMSVGLLLPVPSSEEFKDVKIGDDVATPLGVTHYQPPDPITQGDCEVAPSGHFPVYDLESYFRYPYILEPGELVTITEKIHGCNARFMFDGSRMWCGSHKQWKKPPDEGQAPNLWWKALADNPWIEEFCRGWDGATLYAEIFGPCQDLRYGWQFGKPVMVRGFDIFEDDSWRSPYPIPKSWWVPILADCVEFNLELVQKHISGPSTLADHIREGIVIEPIVPRNHHEIGRVKLKAVNPEYLERAK